MKMFSSLRRVVPVVAVIALALLASCTPVKKYGCPNGLKVSSIIK